MVLFMENHSNLALGNYVPESQASQLWARLVKELDAAGPPTKLEKDWKTVRTCSMHNVIINLFMNQYLLI